MEMKQFLDYLGYQKWNYICFTLTLAYYKSLLVNDEWQFIEYSPLMFHLSHGKSSCESIRY